MFCLCDTIFAHVSRLIDYFAIHSDSIVCVSSDISRICITGVELFSDISCRGSVQLSVSKVKMFYFVLEQGSMQVLDLQTKNVRVVVYNNSIRQFQININSIVLCVHCHEIHILGTVCHCDVLCISCIVYMWTGNILVGLYGYMKVEYGQ